MPPKVNQRGRVSGPLGHNESMERTQILSNDLSNPNSVLSRLCRIYDGMEREFGRPKSSSALAFFRREFRRTMKLSGIRLQPEWKAALEEENYHTFCAVLFG